MISIPYVYAVPGTAVDEPMWYGAIHEHEPRTMDHPGGSFVFAPMVLRNFQEAFVAEDRFWLPVELGAVASLWERHLTVTFEDAADMRRIGLPLAGIGPGFVQKKCQLPVALPGLHDDLPERIAAEALAAEIASRTAMVDGRLHTSSYEPYVAQIHPAKSLDSGALALKDVHGLWRHPFLRVLSPYRRAPFLPLGAALADPSLVPWSKEGFLGTADASHLDGFVPTISEPDTVCYDVLRSAVEAVRRTLVDTRPVEESSWRTIDEAEDLLCAYEDTSSPPPPFDVAANLLRDVFDLTRETSTFGIVLGSTKVGLRRMESDFALWWETRGSAFEIPQSADRDDRADIDAISSFGM